MLLALAELNEFKAMIQFFTLKKALEKASQLF
jgi:hypothetical protein